MLRITIASFVLGLGAARAVHAPSLAGAPSVPAHVRSLARGDTLSATTPANYPLDLTRGPVVFFTSGGDSIRVIVGRNPFGATDRVSAQGRRLSVRLLNGSVVIDRR